MKKTNHTWTTLFASLLLAAVAPTAIFAEEAPATELKIVFIAYQNPEQLVEDVKPVIAYLEKVLKVAVKYFMTTDYASVVEGLRNKSADMGFMGPLQYVIAHEQSGAYPILGEVYGGKSYYTSRIFVRKDSGFKSLADLRGKTIAFVDPISSSGYLYPLDLFKEKGLFKDHAEEFFKRIYFAGGDEQAMRAVYNNFVDAAGIGQFSYSLLRPKERNEIIYIGESKRLPSHCVVVRKDLNRETVQKLRDALMALNDGPDHGLLRYLYNVDGYVEVGPEDFDEVREVARAYGFVKGD